MVLCNFKQKWVCFEFLVLGFMEENHIFKRKVYQNVVRYKKNPKEIRKGVNTNEYKKRNILWKTVQEGP